MKLANITAVSKAVAELVEPRAGAKRNTEQSLEDKIVQRATVAVLNAIYEEDFLGFSYGFRPKKGQHNACLQMMCAGFVLGAARSG